MSPNDKNSTTPGTPPSDQPKSHYAVVPRRVAPGVQDIFNPGRLSATDNFRIMTVASDGQFPFFVMNDSSVGYMWKVGFVNGKAWDESTRMKFLQALEFGLRLDSQTSTVDYTYGFSVVRRPMRPEDYESYKDEQFPMSEERISWLQTMAGKLEVQSVDLYFNICASPSKFLMGSRVGFLDKLRVIWEKITTGQSRLSYQIESELLEDVVRQFGDKVRQTLALFASRGVGTICPKDEKELLVMARRAWRPNYHPANPTEADKSKVDAVLRSLREDTFVSAGDFLTRDLRIDQFQSHWVSDGCFNMLFSLEDCPDPNVIFSASEVDRILGLGIQPGVSNIPYFGTYTVAWSSMTREEGAGKFKLKSLMASAFTTDKKGLMEDRLAAKEASDIDRMYSEYIQGGGDMVRACVMYQLSIPLEHMSRFFGTNMPERDLVRSVARSVGQQLAEIGFSGWRLENRTYYTSWINSIPGAIKSVGLLNVMPRVYMTLQGALHLSPLYATVGPENINDRDVWRGSNYFVSDEATPFVFDHFSNHNGSAANYCICGGTGSGKSVTAQTLIMMTETLNPNIMILDFGGGLVGSWTKLCAVQGGVELKFGDPKPPRINPFQLPEADSYPNMRKKREIAIELGMDLGEEETISQIDSVYIFLRGGDTPTTDDKVITAEIFKRCPAFDGKNYQEIMEILRLGPGKSRPGEKSTASIRIVLELILSSNVTEDGPTDHVWSSFSLDDINEALLKLYEGYLPPANAQKRWPTLSDFRDQLRRLNTERRNGSDTSDWAQGHVFNYSMLMTRLNNYCAGGLESFLDGQTDVDIRRPVMRNGVEHEENARFILADMAGITDKRKLALYMIVINDFMSSILYGSRERRGIIIRDEAWLFMKSKIANPYLEQDYRLARKYGFSVITIAQQYSDFQSPVLQNNTQNWVVCSLSSTDEINRADMRFRFNEKERDLFQNKMMGRKSEKDVFTGRSMESYARIMIANNSGKYFVKNKISKTEQWITTTDPDETFVFNYYRERDMRGRPAIEIIRWLVTDEYQKDIALQDAIRTAGRKLPRL